MEALLDVSQAIGDSLRLAIAPTKLGETLECQKIDRADEARSLGRDSGRKTDNTQPGTPSCASIRPARA